MSTHSGYGQAKRKRLNDLEQLLLGQPERRWRTSEIAQKFGVSEDTALRDLMELSDSGRVPLYNPATFVWQVHPDSKATLPPLQLEYAQGAALYAAARLLSQQYDERNDAIRAALTRLINILPEPLRPHLETIMLQLGEAVKAPSNISSIFEALSQGWLLRRVVKLHYEPPHLTPYTCQFHPYLLEPSAIGRTLYFIGYSDPPQALRTYKLERVRHAELTKETFEIPDNFDGPALLRKAWGIMYGYGEAAHVKLRFTQFVSKRVRETRWHPSETVTELPGGLLWEADIGDVTEIRPWIRGWGADCEVLEPATLREEMVREARKLARLYELPPDEAPSGDEPNPAFLKKVFRKE